MDQEICVAICCPRERMAMWQFIDGRYAICKEAVEYGIKTKILERATIYIGEMRSVLSHEVVARPELTHALFLDADSVPPPKGLVALVERDLDIVSGLYFQRDDRAHPVAFVQDPDGYMNGGDGRQYRPVRPEITKFLNDHNIPPLWGPILIGDIGEDRPELLEVDVAGAGFLLIKREVLEACSDWHMNDRGEDICWCERVKDLGYKIWLDPGVIVGHVGMVPFSTAWFLRSCELLREEEADLLEQEPEPGQTEKLYA